MNALKLVEPLGVVLENASGTEDEDSWVDYLASVQQAAKTHRLLTILPNETGFGLEILILTNTQECLEYKVKHMHSKRRHAFRRCYICRNLVPAKKAWFFRGIPLAQNIYLQIPVCAQTGCCDVLTFGEKEVPPRKVCAGCYKTDPIHRCTFCRSAMYCSAICRDRHWVPHKDMCKKLAKIYFKKIILPQSNHRRGVSGGAD